MHLFSIVLIIMLWQDVTGNILNCMDLHKNCDIWVGDNHCVTESNVFYLCPRSCKACVTKDCESEESGVCMNSFGTVDQTNEEKINIVFVNDTPETVEIFWVETIERILVIYNDLEVSVTVMNSGSVFAVIRPKEYMHRNTHLHTHFEIKSGSDPTSKVIRDVLITGILSEFRVTTSGKSHKWLSENRPVEISAGKVAPHEYLGQITYINHIWHYKNEQGDTIRMIQLALSAGISTVTNTRIYTISGKHPFNDEWLNVFPRDPVRMPMHKPLEPIGSSQLIVVRNTYWDSENLQSLTKDDPYHPILSLSMITQSINPRIWRIPDFISEKEGNKIIEFCHQYLFASPAGAADEIRIQSNRKSKTCWLKIDPNKNGFLRAIAERAYTVMNMSFEEGLNSCEELQVVKYRKGGIYKAHHDYFPPASSQRMLSVQSGSNRYATILFYLKAPKKGGGTSFPHVNDVETGFPPLVITPKLGQAILWYHLTPDGNLDLKSKHQGDLVEEGEKWIASFFCWDSVI